MKKRGKYNYLWLILLMLILSACSTEAQDDVVDIGILSLMDHNSLNAAEEGFMDGMTELGYIEGETVRYHRMNAQGQQVNIYPMVSQLMKKSELALGIATPTIQAMAVTEEEKPLLFTAVTDPMSAGIATSEEFSERNITGTTDQMPVDQQVELLLSVKPEAEKVGIIYSSGEVNSRIQAEQAISAIEAAGKVAVARTVTSTNEVQMALSSLMDEVELLYIPTDNILASAASSVGALAINYKVPVVAGSLEQVEAGGLATYSLDYYQLGQQTALMADRIINGEAVEDIEIENGKELELFVNEDMAEALGIDPISIQLPND